MARKGRAMAVTEQSATLAAQSDDDLSDEQIQRLLKDAEVRLREKAAATSPHRETLRLPRLDPGSSLQPYIETNGKIARLDESQLEEAARKTTASTRPIRLEDPVIIKQNKEKAKKASTGPQWFNMPHTDLTPAFKRDLQLLKMVKVLDTHRHYKNDKTRLTSEYMQVGTIIEGPTDFFNARLEKRERKETITDEVLAGEKQSGKFKRKYDEIQTKKTSGKKAHYTALMEKRKRSFKR